MKILLAAASFTTSISGVQRHAFNLARCLLLRPEIGQLHLVVAPWQSHMPQAAGLRGDSRLATHRAAINRSSLSRNLWYYFDLPRLAARLQVDLVHFSYPMPVNASAFHCPTVVSLHDLYPFEIPANFGFPKVVFNRGVLRQCLRNASVIACVSDATRMRLRQYAGSSECDKSLRIYNCVEPVPGAAKHSPIPRWSGEKFLLCVAQHRCNKNLPALLRVFERLSRCAVVEPDTKLVVVGIVGPETREIRRLAAASGLSGRIHLLEALSEPELQWCYRHCELLVAPSLTEGFGLPVAEALLAGCRVVCSDIAAHREIANGHCRFVPLEGDFEAAFATAIVETLSTARPAPIVLPQLSAVTIARQYVDLYRELVTSAACAQAEESSKSGNIQAAQSRLL
jgi:glycosyltransferase involved in cell wall biosynthesis